MWRKELISSYEALNIRRHLHVYNAGMLVTSFGVRYSFLYRHISLPSPRPPLSDSTLDAISQQPKTLSVTTCIMVQSVGASSSVHVFATVESWVLLEQGVSLLLLHQHIPRRFRVVARGAKVIEGLGLPSPDFASHLNYLFCAVCWHLHIISHT